MKIRFIFGHEEPRAAGPPARYLGGDVHDVDDELARRLVKAGKAEPCREPKAQKDADEARKGEQ